MSETATENPDKPPQMSEEISAQMENVKIEQNGIPAGDTGMPTAPVTPQVAAPASPQVGTPASPVPASSASPPAAESPAQPQPANALNKEEGKEQKPESKGQNGQSKEPNTQQSTNIKQMFKAFSKFGDTKSDGKLITLSQR